MQLYSDLWQGLVERLEENEQLTVNTLTGDLHMPHITVTDLFTFMGRELEAMDEIPAGNILGKIYVIFCESSH